MDENELVTVDEEAEAVEPAADEGGESVAEEIAEERDFSGEVSALLTAFPDTAGKSLPDEVIRECVGAGVPLVRAYAAYRERTTAGRVSAFPAAPDSYAHAPVRAASVGAPRAWTPADPFLEGLNAY